VKKRDLEKKLRKLGWERVRHGANHDIWSILIVFQKLDFVDKDFFY